MAKGFITDIKTRKTNWGDYHDVYIDNKNLGGGKFPPKGISVGDYVEYEAEKNSKGYDQIKSGSLRKLDKPDGVEAPKPPAPPVVTMDKQDVISRQAALNSALTFVGILSQSEALPIAKNLAAAKRADALKEIVLHYTGEFFHLSTGAKYDIPEDVVGEVAKSWDEAE